MPSPRGGLSYMSTPRDGGGRGSSNLSPVKRRKAKNPKQARGRMKKTDSYAVETGIRAVQLGRAARSTHGKDAGVGTGSQWDVYERTLDKFMEDGKLSGKENRQLKKLAKELRKAEQATSQASAEAVAYANGVSPTEREDRGLAIAQAIGAAVAGAGAAGAAAAGYPDAAAALQGAATALGVPASDEQVSSKAGQQQVAQDIGTAAYAADYDGWIPGTTMGQSYGIIGGMAALVVAVAAWASSRGNKGDNGGGYRREDRYAD